MRKVIFDLVQDAKGIRSYPDDVSLFANTEDAPPNVIADYYGEDDSIMNYDEGYVAVSVIDIAGPAVLMKEDDNSAAVVKQLTDLIVTVAIDLPDTSPVLVPLKRNDTGRIVKVFGVVSNGEVILNLQLPTAGDWYCDSELINDKTEKGLIFSFSDLKLTVVL